MYFLKYIRNLFILLVLRANIIKSDIENCEFLNTINLTELDTKTYLKRVNQTELPVHLVASYDYIKLKNGTRLSVAAHKRFCICPNPCLNLCSVYPQEIYNEFDYMRESFQLEIIMKNGQWQEKDVIKDFNHHIITPCTDMYVLNNIDNVNDWSIIENGSIFLHKPKQIINHDEYCFNMTNISSNDNENDYFTVLLPSLCVHTKEVNEYDHLKNLAMAHSIPFFLLTIIIYCRSKRLKNCHGKCFIMYLISLTITYALICFTTLTNIIFSETICLLLGYSIYFSTMTFLTWTCIISYDTYITLTRINDAIFFRKYFMCGLLVPSATTFLIYGVQSLKNLDDELKPGIEYGTCGVNTERWSATVYYYIPHIITLLYSLSLYIKVVRCLNTHERRATIYAGRMKSSNRKRFCLYFRLFMFMGVIWFLEILSYFTEMILEKRSDFIFVADLFNSLHGLFIFLTFMCKSKYCCKLRRKQQTEFQLVNVTTATESDNVAL